MVRKRVIAALAGAAALLGVASVPAFAHVNAENDGVFEVEGSRLVLRIRQDLLANDRQSDRQRKFFRAFGNIGEGIERIRRDGNRLIIRFADDFFGDTSFKYEIGGRRRGRLIDTSRAKVFISVLSPT